MTMIKVYIGIKRQIIFLAILTLLLMPSTSKALTSQKYPIHLADIWWNCSQLPVEFESLVIAFKLDRQLQEKDFIYIAPLGYAELNSAKIYGGFQTDLMIPDEKSQIKSIDFGKGLIASRWFNSKDSDRIGYAVAEHGSQTVVGDTEGSFVSLRRPTQWKSDAIYEFRLSKNMSVGKESWISLSAVESKSGVITGLGRLKAEGKRIILAKNLASFVEIYSEGIKANKEFKVHFYLPIINGNICKNPIVDVRYSGANIDIAKTTFVEANTDEIIVSVGEEKKNIPKNSLLNLSDYGKTKPTESMSK